MGFHVGLSNSPPPLSYFSGKTKFRAVASLSNGRRVSISRAKSAKWISIRPSTRVHSARGSNFFFRRLFSSFRCLAPLHLTKLSPRASLVAAIKFAWKLFRVERPNLNSPPRPVHPGIDIIPQNASVIFWSRRQFLIILTIEFLFSSDVIIGLCSTM